MFKYLVTAFVAMAFVGCSFDKSDNGAAARENKENEKLIQELSVVKGLYAGTLVQGSTTYNIQVNLDFNQKLNNGEDGNGQNSTRPQLKADYKRISPVGPGYTFDVKYVKESGSLTFINIDANKTGPNGGATLGPDDVHTIYATVIGLGTDGQVRITGDAKNPSAVKIGNIDIVLISKQAQVPNDKQAQADYDRLKAEYQTFIGDYVGNNVGDTGTREWKLRIKLRNQQVGELSIPVLYGTLVRTDDQNQVGAFNLAFAYNNNGVTKSLHITAKPINYPGSPYVADLQGDFRDNAFVGVWTSTRGYEGDFNFKKVRSATSDDGAEAPATDLCQGREIREGTLADWPTLPDVGPCPYPHP